MADQSIDILIRTRAELAGAVAVQQQLERDIGKLKALGGATDELKAKTEQLNRVRAAIAASPAGKNPVDLQAAQALAAQIPVIGQYVGRLQSAQTALAGLSAGALPAAAAIAAVGVALAVVTVGLKELDQDAVGEGKLVKALGFTGQFSQDAVAKIQGIADALERTAGVPSSEALAQFVKFLQTGGLVEDVDEFAGVVSRVADVMQVDFAQAATLVNRALNGQAEILARKLNLELKLTGDRTKDLAILLEALKGRSEGMATNLDTMSGAFTRAKTEVMNFIKSNLVLQGLYAGITGHLRLFGAAIGWVAEKSKEASDTFKGWIGVQVAGKNATQETKIVLDEYTLSVDEAKAAVEELLAVEQRSIDLMKEKESALSRSQQASKKLALATIKDLETRGRITPQQATVMRAQSEQAFAAQELVGSQSSFERELASRRGAYDQEYNEISRIADEGKRFAALDALQRGKGADLESFERSGRIRIAGQREVFGIETQTRRIEAGTELAQQAKKAGDNVATGTQVTEIGFKRLSELLTRDGQMTQQGFDRVYEAIEARMSALEKTIQNQQLR